MWLTSFFIVIFFILPIPVFAVDFSIENSQIDAYLQENGDVRVTEQHTYQFDGEFNGITRTLIPKKDTVIEAFQALEHDEPLQVTQENNLYKIYRGGSDETITITLSYRILDSLEAYRDMTQFYWAFFDSSNEATYENMTITIHPPQPTNEVVALGYDSAYGTSSTTNEGITHFNLGKVSSGNNGDIRVAYDTKLFSEIGTIQDTTIQENILADKSNLAEQAAAYENRKYIINQLSPFIIGLVLIGLFMLLIYFWRRKKSILWEIERRSMQSSLIPKQTLSLPATILFRNKSGNNGQLLTAALLDLVRKGYANKVNEQLFKAGENKPALEHEQLLIDWLFYKIGENGTFSLSNLETYTANEQNHSTYYSDLTAWKQAIQDEIKTHALVEKKLGLRWTLFGIGLLLITLAVFQGIHSLFVWMSVTIFLSIMYITCSAVYQQKTRKGLQIKQQWDQFEAAFSRIHEQEWHEWMNDEQMQAFIYAVGTGNTSIQDKSKALSENFTVASTSSTTNHMQTNDMLLFIFLANSLSNRFEKADTTVAAATTSSSGTPGVGSGVGGGGGGSGAF